MNLGDEYQNILVFIALIIAADEGGRRTFNSFHQIYHRRRRWAMEFIAAVGTKLKSVYIAKSRQRYCETPNNILLHVPNHDLKHMYMLKYWTVKNTTVWIMHAFLLLNSVSYNLIKTDSLGFLHIF